MFIFYEYFSGRTQYILMYMSTNQGRLLTSLERKFAKYGLQFTSLVIVTVVFLCLRTLRYSSQETTLIDEQNQPVYTNRFLLTKDDDDAIDTRCVDVHHINSSEKCWFVRNTDDCHSEDGFFQYIQFPYCTLSNTQPLAFIVLVLWLIFLFIFIGITADDYFCPALTVVSDSLKLSPNVAGVTFLAYGNGAPDIFSAVAGFVNNKSTGNLALSALIGAGMFVTTVVVGVVSLSVSYDLNQRPYLRDVIFYLGALAWTIIIIYRKKIDLFQAIGFIVLYVAYVAVVIVGRVVYQKYKRRLRDGAVQERSSTGGLNERDQFDNSIPVVCEGNNEDETTPLLVHFKPRTSQHIRTVLKGLCHFSQSNFVDSGILTKIYTTIKIPIHFCLSLTVPVVELDEADQNWNKWLQVLQCFFTPLFCLFATKGGLILIGGKFPLAILIALIGIAMAIAVALTSTPAVPPFYHKLFAFMSFVSSVIWIYTTANEIVNLLRMFGIVFKLSNEILGLTLLAWGNSIADFIANLAVAKQGFPQMAIAACFGGPLLNLLLGVGLSCTIATARDNVLPLETSRQDYISTIFLAFSLASSAIVVPLLGFRIPRWYGVFLILLYLIFLILSVLNETKVF